MTSVTIISKTVGFIIVSIGVVGLYVGRIFEQVKNRPLYLIDEQAAGPRELGRTSPPQPGRDYSPADRT